MGATMVGWHWRIKSKSGPQTFNRTAALMITRSLWKNLHRRAGPKGTWGDVTAYELERRGYGARFTLQFQGRDDLRHRLVIAVDDDYLSCRMQGMTPHGVWVNSGPRRRSLMADPSNNLIGEAMRLLRRTLATAPLYGSWNWR